MVSSNDPRYVNAYNFVHLDFNSLQGYVDLRRWSDRSSAWLSDTDSYNDGQFIFHFPKSSRLLWPSTLPSKQENMDQATTATTSSHEKDKLRKVDFQIQKKNYLHWLTERNLYLDARGTYQTQRQVQVKLDEVYISLRAQREEVSSIVDRRLLEQELIELEAKITTSSHLSLETEDQRNQIITQLKNSRLSAIHGLSEEVIELAEVVNRHVQVVILGDPGSGKSTLLRYLALKHAQALLDGQTEVGGDLGVAHFPILIRIADYTEHALSEGKSLSDFLEEYCHMHECPVDGLADLLAMELAGGNCLVLVDGLDEIVKADDRRKVVQQIEDFVRRYGKPPNCFIVTSRIAGYRSAPLSEVFNHYTVQDMDDSLMLRFLQRWCSAVEAAQTPELSEEMRRIVAKREIDGIIKAVQKSPGVRRLASNPLLLRTLALIHRTGARLPQKRIQLYRLAADTLAETWRKAQGVPESALFKDEYLTPLLGKLAYWLHSKKATGIATREEVCEVLGEEWANLNDLHWGADNPNLKIMDEVGKFLVAVREHTGIFVERAPGRYGFMHLTFEEYYTARYLVARSKNRAKLLREHLHDPRWNEPILLALGFVGLESAIESSELLETAILAEGEEAKKLGFNPSSYESLLGRDFLFALHCLGDNIPIHRRLLRQLIQKLNDELLYRKGSAHFWRYGQALEATIEHIQGSEGASLLSPHLITAMAINDSVVLRRAARCLGLLGQVNNEVVEALLNVSGCKYPEVRFRVAQSLGRLGSKEPNVVSSLINLLYTDEKYFVRAAAAKSLGQLEQASPEVVTALIDALLSNDELVYEQAAKSLGSLARLSSEVQNELLAIIDDINPRLRAGALLSFGFLEQKPITDIVERALFNALNDPDPRVQVSAMLSFRHLGQVSPKLEATLIDILHSNDLRVQFEALQSLGRLKREQVSQETVVTLLNIIEKGFDPVIRSKAALSLGLLGQTSDKVMNTLLDVLEEDNNPDVRSASAESVGQLGNASDVVITALHKALSDGNPRVRYQAIKSLELLRKTPANATNLLFDILQNPGNKFTYQDSALLLSRIGQYNERILQVLWKGLRDDDYNVRIACAQALAQLGQRFTDAAPRLASQLADAIINPNFSKSDTTFLRPAQDYAYYSLWMLVVGSGFGEKYFLVADDM